MSYKALYQALGYQFTNENLLIRALTRTSAFNIRPELKNNGDYQRLEFLGDKIIGQVVGDVLFDHHPEYEAGSLTMSVAAFVNNNGPLAEIALKLGLDQLLIMDQGEEHNNQIRQNIKALSDATEALMGAIWVDSNRDYLLLRKLILKHWNPLGLLSPIKSASDLLIDYQIKGTERLKRFALLSEKPCSDKILNHFLLSTGIDEDIEILKIVLDKITNSEILNNALINAIFAGNDALVEHLLIRGADPNFMYPPSYVKDWEYGGFEHYEKYGSSLVSVLQIAVTSNYETALSIIKLLLAYGADPNWNQGWTKQVKFNFSNLATRAFKDVFETTGLSDFFEPASYTYSQIMSLRKPRQEAEKYPNLNTALHVLVKEPDMIANIEKIIDLLVSAGADVTLEDSNGKTALQIAVSTDNEAAARALSNYMPFNGTVNTSCDRLREQSNVQYGMS